MKTPSEEQIKSMRVLAAVWHCSFFGSLYELKEVVGPENDSRAFGVN